MGDRLESWVKMLTLEIKNNKLGSVVVTRGKRVVGIEGGLIHGDGR